MRHYTLPIRVNAHVSARLLQAILRREKIDLVHANADAAGWVAALACGRPGIPWVYTRHALQPHLSSSAHLRQAARIICVAEAQRQCELQAAQCDPARLALVHCGVDIGHFAPPAGSPALRQAWGFATEDFVIGLVARMHTANRKGHLDLFRLLAGDPRAAAWKVALAGSGKTQPLLRYWAWKLGIAERVRFLGHVMHMPPVYGALDVICLPSSSEVFGLSLGEGMAMAKPVVAYAVGGLVEVVEDGVTGYLTPAGDLHALGDRLNTLAQDPAQARAMGAEGRARVERLFNLERVTDQLVVIYRDVLCQGQVTRAGGSS
jgi:glycosyltransferase involved in cell wall biosynthesis